MSKRIRRNQGAPTSVAARTKAAAFAVLLSHKITEIQCFSANQPSLTSQAPIRIAAENIFAAFMIPLSEPRIRRQRRRWERCVDFKLSASSSTKTQSADEEPQVKDATTEPYVSSAYSKKEVVTDGMQENYLFLSDAASVTVSDNSLSSGVETASADDDDAAASTYRKGLITIGFITFLFASNSPSLHAAFTLTSEPPPVLLVNAAVTAVGLTGVALGSPVLGTQIPDPSIDPAFESMRTERSAPMAEDIVQSDRRGNDDTKAVNQIAPLSQPYDDFENSNNMQARFLGPSTLAGTELGLYKFFGTTANIYGLSLTSSDHGAFLIQLTTLIVPVAQGVMGVPIPTRIWTAIGLALGGIYAFTQDPTQANSATLEGDLLCAMAAVFYALYDLRLFKWGKVVPTGELITTKMVTQSTLSAGLLLGLGWDDTCSFFANASPNDLELTFGIVLWSGLAVNALAPYLQVSGQQAVGPARAQILYASQPLWAAIMGFAFLGETVGPEGAIGGIAFLCAMFLAATAETPDPNCEATECEV